MFNRHFAELWKLPPALMHDGLDKPVLKAVAAQTKDPDEFIARVKYLNEHPEIKSRGKSDPRRAHVTAIPAPYTIREHNISGDLVLPRHHRAQAGRKKDRPAGANQ